MKINKVVLKTELRSLLTNKTARDLTAKIFKANSPNEYIFLAETNGCISDTNSYWSTRIDEAPSSEDIYKHCYSCPEYQLVNYLIKHKYMKGRVVGNDDGDLVLEVTDKNIKKIKEAYDWTLDFADIISYGLLSLNLRTGIVYFRNHKTRLRPGSKYSEILKQLATNAKHTLTFDEMDRAGSLKSDNRIITYDQKEYAINAAKYIKQKLSMKKGYGKMLHIYDGKGFKLEENQR